VDEALKTRLSVTVIAGRQNPDAKFGSPGGDPESMERADLPAFSKRRQVAADHSGAPQPAFTMEQREQMLSRQGNGRGRKVAAKMRQTQLPLAIISKGRFDKSEPTIHKGEDLDIPTYIRRGVALN
jgi:hypothetical protein